MRIPAFCICENKGTDQLHGNHATDQHFCFRYQDSRTIEFLNPKFHTSSHLLWLYSPVFVGLGSPEDRFARDVAQIVNKCILLNSIARKEIVSLPVSSLYFFN